MINNQDIILIRETLGPFGTILFFISWIIKKLFPVIIGFLIGYILVKRKNLKGGKKHDNRTKPNKLAN